MSEWLKRIILIALLIGGGYVVASVIYGKRVSEAEKRASTAIAEEAKTRGFVLGVSTKQINCREVFDPELRDALCAVLEAGEAAGDGLAEGTVSEVGTVTGTGETQTVWIPCPEAPPPSGTVEPGQPLPSPPSPDTIVRTAYTPVEISPPPDNRVFQWAVVDSPDGDRWLKVSDVRVYVDPPGTVVSIPVEAQFDISPPPVDRPDPRTLLGGFGYALVGDDGAGWMAGLTLEPARWAFNNRLGEGRLGLSVGIGDAPGGCYDERVSYDGGAQNVSGCASGRFVALGITAKMGVGRR